MYKRKKEKKKNNNPSKIWFSVKYSGFWFRWSRDGLHVKHTLRITLADKEKGEEKLISLSTTNWLVVDFVREKEIVITSQIRNIYLVIQIISKLFWLQKLWIRSSTS